MDSLEEKIRGSTQVKNILFARLATSKLLNVQVV